MNKELLFQLYGVFSPSGKEKKMRKFVKDYIRKNCGDCSVTQDKLGNLFIVKGQSETYPCVAAHLDQVQKYHTKDFTCMEVNDKVFGWSPKNMEQQGLGADDKNGIWICLECLRRYDVLKVAFFVGEEVGCEGSGDCDLDFFKDCRFIIEPDRRGSSDLITDMFCGDVCSKEFVKAIDAESYGYTHDSGSITDVGELVQRGVGISCLNLSCGYYRPHTDEEYTCLTELENCLDFVRHIIETCTDVYPFEYERYSMQGYNSSYYSGYEEDDDYEMMDQLISQNHEISFDEVCNDWCMNFNTRDKDILRDIYDDVRYYMGLDSNADFWNGMNDDAGEIVFDLPQIKKVS